jgi:hypothetical protein
MSYEVDLVGTPNELNSQLKFIVLKLTEQPWLVKGKVSTAAPCILSASTMDECD